MMDEIRKILQKNKVAYSEKNGWLSVEPDSEKGFEVNYAEDERFSYVSCSGWHEKFKDREDAKNCYLNALTKRVQIIVTAKGGFEYKWEYQARENDIWQGYGTTGLLLFPFWHKSKTIIRSNEWLK